MKEDRAGHTSTWMPSASLPVLKQAASLRTAVRGWMLEQGILEVCTPCLSFSATTDPQIESLQIASSAAGEKQRYLHTSPEFAMKRILCANPYQDIYQIATVFRGKEQGRYHVSQFAMLEWYRVGMDHKALMLDTQMMLKHIWASFDQPFPAIDTLSYSQLVFDMLGQWPDELEGKVIKNYFEIHRRSFPVGLESDSSASLDLFVDEFVLPMFDESRITFLCEYPASQAALARIGQNASDHRVAERFEVYLGQIELANGFHELADASQQRKRFEQDIDTRKLQNQPTVPMDENLLNALSHGLPDCAGIAVGLDRLLMVLGGYAHINDVLSFSDEHA